MKPGKPLRRYARLERSTPLAGGAPPRRTTPMRSTRRRHTGPDRDVKSLLASRSGGMCEIGAVCGGLAPAVDPSHRVAKGMGGTSDPRSNTAANNLAACRPCHEAVESQPARAYAKGWKIRHGVQDPTQEPAKHVRFGWVLLHLDGSWTPVELAECGAHPATAACPECTACRLCGPCGCELVAGWQQRTPA